MSIYGDKMRLGKKKTYTHEEFAEHRRRETLGLDCVFCKEPIVEDAVSVEMEIVSYPEATKREGTWRAHRNCALERDAIVVGES